MIDPLRGSQADLLVALFEKATEGMLIASREGNLLDFNTAGCQQTGYDAKTLHQLSLLDLFPESAPTPNLQFHNYQMRQQNGRFTTISVETRTLTNGRFLLILHHPTENTPTREKIIRLTETIQTVNHLATNLNSLLTATDPLKQIAIIVRDIPGVFAVSVSSYQTKTDELVVEHLEMPANESSLLSQINTLLGRTLIGMRIPLNDEMRQRMFEERIAIVGTLHEVTFGNIPQAASALFHKTFRLDKLYGLALVDEDELLGTIVIVMRRNAEPLTPELQVMLSRICAIMLRRARYEQRLQASEAKFRSYIEYAPLAIMVVDENGRYQETNPTATHMFGYTKAEFQERSIDELVDTAFLSQSWGDFQTIRTTGAASGEYLLRHKDGSPVWAAIQSVRLDDNRFMTVVQDITARKKAEKSNKLKDDLLYLTGEMGHIGGWEFDAETLEGTWTDEVARIHELDPAEKTNVALGISFYEPKDQQKIKQAVENAIENGQPYDLELTLVTAQGRHKWIRTMGLPIFEDGKVVKIRGIFQDITERKEAEREQAQLEAQLRQVQKMDSIGRLAGGVAHDFNNLLTVIQMYVDLMHAQMPADDPLLPKLTQIRHASERASDLTRQLLAFSRKQFLKSVILDLNELITNLQKMLGRLIGEDINLVVSLTPDLRSIQADPGQIEQVIMNLIVNARDAMPTGGALTIETQNVYLDENFLTTQLQSPSGHCVLLAITDTGHGMDEATRQRIFEPFFTTKEPGSGIGLGLATVHGIVRQSGGSIFVYSEPDHGTTFKIYLPTDNAELKDTSMQPPEIVDNSGTETILVVEDEEAVRGLICSTLKACGYTILAAKDGYAALALMEKQNRPVDLLLTDIIMPKMSGRELAEQLTEQRPELKVLFMSGYMDDAVVRHGILTAQVAFLAKPFYGNMLANKVREVLDE